MCGRYVSVRSDADVLTEFDAVYAAEGRATDPDWNVAPTKPVRAIVNRPLRDEDGAPAAHPTRQLRVMSWGLVPSWAKERSIGSRMINARVEGLATKPAFRGAYARRRCLVPADGWYEWRVVDGPDGPRKQPTYLTPADGGLLAFAGLFEFWGPPGATLTTCAVLTAPATGQLAEVHDRMPLLLPRGSWDRWLDPAVTDPADLLEPAVDAGGFELRPVATAVNRVDNNGPHLVQRVDPLPEPQVLF